MRPPSCFTRRPSNRFRAALADMLRLLVTVIVPTIYRVRARGLANIPASGPVLLVCNHVSFVDALLIGSVCRRPVRFVMDHRIFSVPVLSLLFRAGRAIPIAPQNEDPRRLERAFDDVAAALMDGDVVCLFPEGRITHTGELGAFRPGVLRILERSPVPVVPLALRGLWGSFFSRAGGVAMRRPFRRFWSRVEVVAGSPVPAADVTCSALRDHVAALRGAAP